MSNFIHPDAVEDISNALIIRASVALPNEIHLALEKAIVRHFHATREQSIPARVNPSKQPAWAIGKELSHPLPTSDLQAEIRRVAPILKRAHMALDNDAVKRADSTLHQQLSALLRALPHQDWPSFVARCDDIGDRFDTWTEAQNRTWTRQLVAAGRGMRWRRLRSGRELWEAAAGTKWCVRKGQDFSSLYVNDLNQRDMSFWVLEKGATSNALLSFSSHTGEVAEVKDREGNAPHRYRTEVRRLCRRLGDDAMASRCADMLALGFDDDLGRRGQPYRQGEIVPKRGMRPIIYRLWADGRRKKYLLGLSEVKGRAPVFFLKLAVGLDREWALEGAAPPSWPGPAANLMARVIGEVSECDGRDHWRVARRKARSLG